MRPLFDRDNRLAIIGGLAAAIPVRSKVTQAISPPPLPSPSYLRARRLILVEAHLVGEGISPSKFHRNFDEIFARQSAGTAGNIAIRRRRRGRRRTCCDLIPFRREERDFLRKFLGSRALGSRAASFATLHPSSRFMRIFTRQRRAQMYPRSNEERAWIRETPCKRRSAHHNPSVVNQGPDKSKRTEGTQ